MRKAMIGALAIVAVCGAAVGGASDATASRGSLDARARNQFAFSSRRALALGADGVVPRAKLEHKRFGHNGEASAPRAIDRVDPWTGEALAADPSGLQHDFASRPPRPLDHNDPWTNEPVTDTADTFALAEINGNAAKN